MKINLELKCGPVQSHFLFFYTPLVHQHFIKCYVRILLTVKNLKQAPWSLITWHFKIKYLSHKLQFTGKQQFDNDYDYCHVLLTIVQITTRLRSRFHTVLWGIRNRRTLWVGSWVGSGPSKHSFSKSKEQGELCHNKRMLLSLLRETGAWKLESEESELEEPDASICTQDSNGYIHAGRPSTETTSLLHEFSIKLDI